MELTKLFKDKNTGQYSWGDSYTGLIESTGIEILVEESDGDYQGDTICLVRDGDQYAQLGYGWGSCSGCDAYQACHDIKDFVDLRESLVSGLMWDTFDNTIEKILSRDFTTTVYYGQGLEEKFQESVRKYVENL